MVNISDSVGPKDLALQIFYTTGLQAKEYMGAVSDLLLYPMESLP